MLTAFSGPPKGTDAGINRKTQLGTLQIQLVKENPISYNSKSTLIKFRCENEWGMFCKLLNRFLFRGEKDTYLDG